MSIYDVLGIHFYHGYILQLFLAEFLFVPVLKHRSKFWLRYAITFLVFGFISIVLTNLIAQVVSGLTSMTIYSLSIIMCVLLYQNKFKDILFCCIGAQLIQNLAHNVEMLIYLPLKRYMNDVGWFFLSFGVMIVVYFIFYMTIINRMRENEEINIPSGGAFIIGVISILFCYLVQFLLTVYKIDTYWITTLPLIFCDMLAIIFVFGLISYRNARDEKLELEHFISQSNTYYEFVKSNIDMLNMKAHDLKHFINSTKRIANVDDEGLNELQKTIENYEAMAKTGNKALDYILTDKGFVCQKTKIPFTFSVDGSVLSFMKTSDLTSLFGNLLSNAIEAEAKLANKDQAYILLKVMEKGSMVSIHIENYFPEKVIFKNGLPISTKENVNLHGYGTKSIHYITTKYHGNVSIQQENNVYEVNILFPKQESPKRDLKGVSI